jgi:UDP-3-O-[3-hydroxymyristoyl] glucosamine N-acyltransferase
MIAANTVVAGNTNIGDDCWIGVGVHIKNKVNIGNNVFLGIGAIVTNDILDKQKIIPIPSFGEKITFSHIKDMLYKAMR